MNLTKQRPPRPSPGQPGTLREQFAALLHFFSLPWFVREADPDGAWEHARQVAMPHARREVTR